MQRPSRTSGFTLVELLLALAVIAIMVSLAVPNYRSWLMTQQIEKSSQMLRTHIELARSYAQSHQTPVKLCPVSPEQLHQDSVSCLTHVNQWHSWVVKTVADERILARSDRFDEVVIDSGNRDAFVLNERGGANGYNGTITFQSAQVVQQTQITLAADGHTQLLRHVVPKLP